MSNLHAYLPSAKPVPQPVCTSQEIRDRGSTFVANVFRATSEDEARKAVAHLRNVSHGSNRASHEMFAWRCMVLKAGKSGLSGPDDFQMESGSEDDGEKYGGGKILKIMQSEGIIDAVLVVSRWFGGEMLGPARFAHIETCAREVSRVFRTKDEVEECVVTLKSLDDLLASLRAELAILTQANPPQEQTAKKMPDYDDLLKNVDLTKARRLVTARENSIKSVKALLRKAKDSDAEQQISHKPTITND